MDNRWLRSARTRTGSGATRSLPECRLVAGELVLDDRRRAVLAEPAAVDAPGVLLPGRRLREQGARAEHTDPGAARRASARSTRRRDAGSGQCRGNVGAAAAG